MFSVRIAKVCSVILQWHSNIIYNVQYFQWSKSGTVLLNSALLRLFHIWMPCFLEQTNKFWGVLEVVLRVVKSPMLERWNMRVCDCGPFTRSKMTDQHTHVIVDAYFPNICAFENVKYHYLFFVHQSDLVVRKNFSWKLQHAIFSLCISHHTEFSHEDCLPLRARSRWYRWQMAAGR